MICFCHFYNFLEGIDAKLITFWCGFSRSNLIYMRKFYLTFQKSETLSHKLTWSHYFELLK